MAGTAPMLMALTYAPVSPARMGPVSTVAPMRLGMALRKMVLTRLATPSRNSGRSDSGGARSRLTSACGRTGGGRRAKVKGAAGWCGAAQHAQHTRLRTHGMSLFQKASGEATAGNHMAKPCLLHCSCEACS
jgi:hypothetical protein